MHEETLHSWLSKMRSGKILIRLLERAAWASTQSDQSLLCAQWVAKDPSFLHADREDCDQLEWMCRLI